MKTGILTYYGVHNYGAVLQANALKKVLESLNCEVSFLSFDRNYDFISQEQAKKYKISAASLAYYARYLQQKGLQNVLFNLRKKRVLGQYRREKLILGNRYCDYEGDAVVIGSDEVFSLEVGLNPFFYGHGLRVKNVFSYAASFGPTCEESIAEKGCIDIVASGLSRMNAVAVRDYNSQYLVQKISGKIAPLVCDPVILYGYQDEMNGFAPTEKDYIVVYSYDRNMNDPGQIEEIKRFADKMGCKAYSVGFYHKWCDRNIVASPEELLGWIRHARFVVTDTFHGSVLSIICNTPMAVKMEGNQNKVHSLLVEFGLEDRIIDNYGELSETAERKMNFGKLNDMIDEKRKYAMEYIINTIKEANND